MKRQAITSAPIDHNIRPSRPREGLIPNHRGTTVATNRIYPFQVLLPAPACGLDHDSKAQADQVRSVAVERIGSRIGALPPELLSGLNDVTGATVITPRPTLGSAVCAVIAQAASRALSTR